MQSLVGVFGVQTLLNECRPLLLRKGSLSYGRHDNYLVNTEKVGGHLKEGPKGLSRQLKGYQKPYPNTGFIHLKR
jgi:hypothetical protein